MTLHDCVEEAARILAAAGFAAGDARRDAAVLARFILGWSMTDWAARLRDPAPAFLREQLNALATRRSSGEPVAYITGTREFYGRPFLVTPAVLIPRPETEGLIDEAITVLRTRRTGTRPIVVDIGTGSGCIAVTLALECPGARIVATDISQPALELAAMNAAALGATVEFEHVGGSEFIAPSVPAADLIVSNPPYVSERDRPSLPIDVREFEPHTALFAAGEGLEVIRRLIRVADGVLAPGGALVMEIGAGQAAAVSALVACSSLELAGIRPDLQGIPRIVVARKALADNGGMSSCLFCRIVNGEIPAKKVHEDDRLIAFEDINPQAPMHVLIVPRAHIATMNDLLTEHDALVGSMIRLASTIASERGFSSGGFRAVFNCNADAGQTVFHLHLHVLGGRRMGWPPG